MFSAVKSLIESVQVSREERAIEHFDEALQLLKKTKRSNFQNDELTRECIDHFMNVIVYEKSDYRPFLYLGYILIMYHQHSFARRFLQVAKNLQPEQSDVNRLLDFIRTPPVSREEKLFFEKQKEGELLNFDELEEAIKQKSLSLLTIPVNAQKPEIDLDKRKSIFLCYQDLQTSLQNFYQQLKELDKYENVDALFKRLGPIEIKMRMLKIWMTLSRNFAEYAQTIHLNHQKTLQFIHKSHTSTVSEEDIEELVDIADQIGERLNELSQKSFNISALETEYNKWMNNLERLQEEVEPVTSMGIDVRFLESEDVLKDSL